MRVLFVNEKCGFFGGVEQYVHDCARGLEARGHECYLAFGESTHRDGPDYRSVFHGVEQVRDIRSPAAEGGSELPTLGDVIDSVRPDSIYVHRIDDTRALVERIADQRIVRMVHDHDLYCPRRHKYYAWNGRVCHRAAGWVCWLDGAFLQRDPSTRTGFRLSSISSKMEEMERNRQFHRMVVASRYMRDQMVVNGFHSKLVRIIPPAVTNEPVPSYEAPPNAGEILYVGQLIRGKGVDLLLDAVHGLKGSWRLRIVGEGNARAALEDQVVRKNLTDRVEFMGWVPNHRLGAVYRSADVIAVPSRWPEPFGMIGLESMSAGRPVVGFDVGGISDWLRHEETGLKVPEADVEGMRAAIARILSDPLLAVSLGSRAREVAINSHSFSTFIGNVESVLAGEAAVARPTSRPRAANS